MVYLFSLLISRLTSWAALSKSATGIALEITEVFLLVSGLVLTVGAVGEYLDDHEKLHKLPRWMQWPKLAFVLMVVGGLLGEFLGDAGVFVFSEHLQTLSDQEIVEAKNTASNALLTAKAGIDAAAKQFDQTKKEAGAARSEAASARIELEAEIKRADEATLGLTLRVRDQGPRSLALKNIEQLLSRELLDFKGQGATIMVSVPRERADPELIQFVALLSDILVSAGWDRRVKFEDNPFAQIGVFAFVNTHSPEVTKRAANFLSARLHGVIPSTPEQAQPVYPEVVFKWGNTKYPIFPWASSETANDPKRIFITISAHP